MFSAIDSNFFFRPFIGEQAALGYRDGVRLLVVGESHYGDLSEDGTEFVVEGFIGEGRRSKAARFLSGVQEVITGKLPETQTERAVFWNQIMFSNLIQEPLPDTQSQPTREQFHRGWLAFPSVVRYTMPDLIFFFTKRGWDIEERLDLGTEGESLPDIRQEGTQNTAYLRDFSAVKPGYKVLSGAFRHTSRPFDRAPWTAWANRLHNEVLTRR